MFWTWDYMLFRILSYFGLSSSRIKQVYIPSLVILGLYVEHQHKQLILYPTTLRSSFLLFCLGILNPYYRSTVGVLVYVTIIIILIFILNDHYSHCTIHLFLSGMGTVSLFQLKSQLSQYIPVIGLNRFCMLLFMVYGIHIDCLLQELNSDWQRAATSLLVAIGSHLPELVSYSFSLNY